MNILDLAKLIFYKQTLNKSERPNLKFAKVAKVNPPIIIINTVVKLLIVKYGAYGILM